MLAKTLLLQVTGISMPTWCTCLASRISRFARRHSPMSLQGSIFTLRSSRELSSSMSATKTSRRGKSFSLSPTCRPEGSRRMTRRFKQSSATNCSPVIKYYTSLSNCKSWNSKSKRNLRRTQRKRNRLVALQSQRMISSLTLRTSRRFVRPNSSINYALRIR